MTKCKFIWVIIAGLLPIFEGLAAAPNAQGANLISDGGFEQPIVPSGSAATFYLGQEFSGWVVTGEPGTVSVASGNFVIGGFALPAHGGSQWLDLTGESNTQTGVQQTVSTTSGSVYNLSFWVGNSYEPGYGSEASSTINVFVNGQLLTSALNTDGKGVAAQVWRKFSAKFQATTRQTSIVFMNADPGSDSTNGLDDVSLNVDQNQQ